jgi:hypothetical protein
MSTEDAYIEDKVSLCSPDKDAHTALITGRYSSNHSETTHQFLGIFWTKPKIENIISYYRGSMWLHHSLHSLSTDNKVE